jgi:hypothetical protein
MAYINTLLFTIGNVLGLPVAAILVLMQYLAFIIIVLKIFRYKRQDD